MGRKLSDEPSLNILSLSFLFSHPQLCFSSYTVFLGFTFVLLNKYVYQLFMIPFSLSAVGDNEYCDFFLLPLLTVSYIRSTLLGFITFTTYFLIINLNLFESYSTFKQIQRSSLGLCHCFPFISWVAGKFFL